MGIDDSCQFVCSVCAHQPLWMRCEKPVIHEVWCSYLFVFFLFFLVLRHRHISYLKWRSRYFWFRILVDMDWARYKVINRLIFVYARFTWLVNLLQYYWNYTSMLYASIYRYTDVRLSISFPVCFVFPATWNKNIIQFQVRQQFLFMNTI